MSDNWFDSGSSSSGAGGSWFAGGTTNAKKKAKPAQDPRKQLATQLARVDKVVKSGIMSREQAAKLRVQLARNAQGLPMDLSGTGARKRNAIDVVGQTGNSLGAMLLRNVARPGQAVMSALAESSREGEKNPIRLGPVDLRFGGNVGKILAAGRKGWNLQAHDTPLSIMKEAGDTRAAQGKSTKAFGVLPNSDLRTNPLGAPKPLRGVANTVVDIGGMAALDPLTYATFGLSGEAKAGLTAAHEVLGAEKAGVLATKGLKGLDDADRALLAEKLTPKAYDALKGVRGGLGVRLPTIKENVEGRFTTPVFPKRVGLGEARTLIPGPFAAAKAGSLVRDAEAGRLTAEAADLLKRADTERGAAGKAFEQAATPTATEADALRARIIGQSAVDRAARAEAQGIATAQGKAALQEQGSRLGARLANSRPIAALGDMFVPRNALARNYGRDVAAKVDDARAAFRGGFQAAVEDDLATLRHAAKVVKPSEEDAKLIARALDIGPGNADRAKAANLFAKVGGGSEADAMRARIAGQSATDRAAQADAAARAIPERLQPLLDAAKKVRSHFTDAQLEAGLLKPEALHDPDTYFPRVLTKQGEKYVGKTEGVSRAVPGSATVAGINDPFRKGRKLMTDSPVSEINTAQEAKVGGPLFEESAPKALMSRSLSAHRAVAAKGFADTLTTLTDSTGQRLARAVESLPKNARGVIELPQGWVDVNIPSVGHYAMPKELAAEARKVAPLVFNEDGLRKFVGALDKWQTLWKGYATVPFVFGFGFHERNAIGNVFNNWLAGIKPTDSAYAEAQKLQHLVAKGKREGDTLKYLSGEDRRLIDAARKNDVIGEGWYSIDVPDKAATAKLPFRTETAGGKVKRVAQAANPLSTENAVISTGRKLGSAIEQNARLAHFIAKSRDLGSFEQAARSVRKYLFDYSDLTGTEKEVLKRLVPFYTFTRKNMPVQIEAMLKTPGKFSRFQQARMALADQAPAPEGLYPGYLPELAGTPLPMGVSEALSKVPGLRFDPNQQIVAAPDIPLLNASQAATPLLSLLGSQVPGVNRLVPHRSAEENLGDLLTQMGGGAPGAAVTAAQVAAGRQFFSGAPIRNRPVEAPLYALPFARNREVKGEMQPTITDRQKFVLESLLPLLSKVAGTFPRGETEQDKAPRRRLGALTGLRTYPLGEATQKAEAYRRLDAISKLIADIESQGVEVPKTPRKKKSAGNWFG